MKQTPLKKSIVIIKIGTNILTTPEGKLDLNNLRSLITQIANEADKGNDHFILVTSGAITSGSERLQIQAKTIGQKQAAAAVGQILLMHEYKRFFEQRGYNIGQILLTKDCVKNKIVSQNACSTIFTLLQESVIPIINENDSVATEEIDNRFRDNDSLSCHVAKLVHAKQLILLTDIDGLYTANPKKDPKSRLIATIIKIDDSVFNYIDDEVSTRSRGGMQSKLTAAKEASEAGIQVVIANGRKPNIINTIFTGKFIGTAIAAQKKSRVKS